MGNQLNTLTQDEIEELQETTHFDDKEIRQLLQRYAKYDNSPSGTDGIPMEVVLSSPELSGSPFARRLTWWYLEDGTKKLHPVSYLRLLSVLSERASFEEKSKALFQSLDLHNEGLIRFDELFRLLKSILTPALSDAQIVAFIRSVLQRDDLSEKGVLKYDEFVKLITPQELQEKMTVDLRLATS